MLLFMLGMFCRRKGNRWVNVCFESNVIDVPSNTWWLDSGATIHACNSVYAIINRRSLTSKEQYVFMGDVTRVHVAFLGVVRLHLSIENFLELQNVAYLPSIRINLISVPVLDRLGHSFLFGTGKVNLYRDSLLIDNRTLFGNLYKLELRSLLSFSPTVNNTKRLRLNEKSSIL